jgi:hypothetical protein
MQSPSRRGFLTGRRAAATPWDAFCQRIRRVVEGPFFELEVHDGGAPSARLMPKLASDVHHARVLCAEYGVVLALDGVPHAARLGERPVLWVEPGSDIAACQRLKAAGSKWFVQPGCLLGELVEAGFSQFSDLPCHITVASWLADRSLCDWDAGHTWKSGVEYASVLLNDGTAAGLGPFGEHSHKPLEGARLQRLVAALFQASASLPAQTCLAQQKWPGRYRLDALAPVEGQTVNLAHLLLGHGGDLGWVEWLVLDERAKPHPEPAYAERFSSVRRADEEVGVLASELDARVKTLFDPSHLFPHPGQDI